MDANELKTLNNICRGGSAISLFWSLEEGGMPRVLKIAGTVYLASYPDNIQRAALCILRRNNSVNHLNLGCFSTGHPPTWEVSSWMEPRTFALHIIKVQKEWREAVEEALKFQEIKDLLEIP